MPEISRFYGIVIQIYYGDHPPPHFHANYAGQTRAFGTLKLNEGRVSNAETTGGIGAIEFAPWLRNFAHGSNNPQMTR